MDGWMNQAYSRLSTTHGHITDCIMLIDHSGSSVCDHYCKLAYYIYSKVKQENNIYICYTCIILQI